MIDIFTVDKNEYFPINNISGIDSVIWVERYNKSGEFTIIGDPMHLLEVLPLGTFISHTKTNELMIVETRHVDESENGSGQLIVKGRSVSGFIMSHRVVTLDSSFSESWNASGHNGLSINPMQYDLGDGNSWDHARSLLHRYLKETDTNGIEDLPNFFVVIKGFDTVEESSTGITIIKKLSYLDAAVYKILQSADIGLKVERPGSERYDYNLPTNDGPDPSPYSLVFVVHKGNDVSETVIFNWNDGDINNARYSWTEKESKNGFYSGTNGYTLRKHDPEKTGWDSKMMAVDVSDWDPADRDISEVNDVLHSRGYDASVTQKNKGTLVDASGSKTAAPKFKTDYDIGDTVSVIANYSVNSLMRVTECAITSDVNKEDIIPTLTPIYTTFGDRVFEYLYYAANYVSNDIPTPYVIPHLTDPPINFQRTYDGSFDVDSTLEELTITGFEGDYTLELYVSTYDDPTLILVNVEDHPTFLATTHLIRFVYSGPPQAESAIIVMRYSTVLETETTWISWQTQRATTYALAFGVVDDGDPDTFIGHTFPTPGLPSASYAVEVITGKLGAFVMSWYGSYTPTPETPREFYLKVNGSTVATCREPIEEGDTNFQAIWVGGVEYVYVVESDIITIEYSAEATDHPFSGGMIASAGVYGYTINDIMYSPIDPTYSRAINWT